MLKTLPDGAAVIVVDHSTDWWVASAGFLLAGVTVVAVIVALKTYRAILREAKATEKSVSSFQASQLAARRPIFIETATFMVNVTTNAGTSCTVTLRNLGHTALIRVNPADGKPFGHVRVTPMLAWNSGTVDRRIVPYDGQVTFQGTAAGYPDRTATNDHPRVYVRIPHTDLAGEQPAMTYVTMVKRPPLERWELDGVATVSDGRIAQWGGGWSGFTADEGDDPWPA